MFVMKRILICFRLYSSSPESTEAMFNAVVTCDEEKLTHQLKGTNHGKIRTHLFKKILLRYPLHVWTMKMDPGYL